MLEHQVCECCALMLANGDESGCRFFYGHSHPACVLAAVVGGDSVQWHRWTCAGCGSDMLAGAMSFDAVVL